MVGRGAAAAAHNLRSGGNGLAREAGHVLRRTQVDVAALHGPRHAGVGHGGQRQRGGRAHGFNGRQHRGRAGGAVDADGSRAPLRQQGRGVLRRGAVQAVAVVVHRHHHQHGQVGGDLAGRRQRLPRLVQRRHGLDDQQVSAGLGQSVNLLGKGRARFVQAGLAQRLQAHAQRAHRTGHPGLARLLVLQMFHGLTRQAHPGGVDFRHFPRQSMPRQTETVGAKRVGFKNLRAGLQILLVDRQNQAGVGKVQLVVTAVDEDATGVEHGPHGAVGKHRAAGKDVGELGHSAAMLSHKAGPRQSIFTSAVYRSRWTQVAMAFCPGSPAMPRPLEGTPAPTSSRGGAKRDPAHCDKGGMDVKMPSDRLALLYFGSHKLVGKRFRTTEFFVLRDSCDRFHRPATAINSFTPRPAPRLSSR